MNGKFLFCGIVLFSQAYAAEPAMGKKELLLDNEKVQVVRLVYPPGAESGMHTHEYATRTAYFVKGGKLEMTTDKKDDNPKTITTKDGDLVYLSGTTHNVKNVGTTEVIIIEQELK